MENSEPAVEEIVTEMNKDFLEPSSKFKTMCA